MPRKLSLEQQFARLLTLASTTTGSKPKDIRVEDVEELENNFSCRIPDPIIAYFAAGLGDFYGSGKATKINAIKGLTEQFRELVSEGDQEPRYNPEGWMIFEKDNGSYLGFPNDADSDQQAVYLFDHEGGFTDTPIPIALSERLREFVRSAGGDDHPDSSKEVEPFEVTLIHPIVKERDTGIDEDIFVEHPTFGRGQVVSKDDTGKYDKWEVAFDSGETKLLVAKFLEVIE